MHSETFKSVEIKKIDTLESINDSVFVFNDDNKIKAEQIISKYPSGRQASAILPLFDLAQRQNKGHLSACAIKYVTDLLDVPLMRGYEIATFYSMFNLEKIGRYHIQVCTTTPCWLMGSGNVLKSAKEEAIDKQEIFTVSEVECLGACCGAPVVQINDDFYENLDENKISQIMNDLEDQYSKDKI